METLGQKRARFTLAVSRWVIDVCSWPGYTLRRGEAYRSDEQAEINAIGDKGRAQLVDYLMPDFPQLAAKIKNNTGSGIRLSLHCDGLAEDYNLVVNGRWISNGAAPEWIKAGELWESMGADHRWGGRWGDGNHVSIEHEGRK